jgi:glycosyltransferase involved in cell wall biosynthesis
MNILMVCALDLWSLSEGRGAPTLYRTLEAYGRRGHSVSCVVPTIGANHSYEPLARAKPVEPPDIANVSFERLHLPSLSERRWPLPSVVAKADQKLRFAVLFPWLAARRAEGILRARPVDLLYGYEVHGVLAVRLLRRRWRLPSVSRFQGTVMYPALSSRVAYLRKYEEVVALRTRADLYVMTDDGTRGHEVLARWNPGSQGRMRFWRNGLDMERLTPASPEKAQQERRALGISDEAFVLVMATRLARWKRVDRALSGMPLVRAVLPSALLLIVGDGEERTNLEALASDLRLGDAVRFVGAVPQRDVARYMWAADLFLSLNELSNVGNPLLEAMACGKAIVTLDVGDTRDLIRDGKTGRLLSAGDDEAVATAVIDLARDPSRRRRLEEGAREYAREHFWTWEERMSAEIDEVERLVPAGRTIPPDGRADIAGDER